ncbi:MAG: hypothetical protein WA124_06265 [Smithella sp.]|jgi:hypothetical protein
MNNFRKGKIFIYILILVGVCFMYPRTSLATPPQDLKLSYDAKSQTLAVTITHKSFFPSFHTNQKC